MRNEKLLKLSLLLGDIALLYVALFLALYIRSASLQDQFWFFAKHFLPVYGFWILILFALDEYDLYFFSRPKDFFFNMLIFSVTVFFLSITYFYFLPIAMVAPKTILIFNIIIFAVLFSGWRWISHYVLQKVFHSQVSSVNSQFAYENIHKKIPLTNISEAWFAENASQSHHQLEEFSKRCVDVLFAVIGLLFCLILFPVIAVCIMIDSRGGIFYSQQRVGKNGRIFVIHKFRSMRQDGTQDKKVWRENEKNTITRVGAVLRRLHLDELPQAWSMLKGDISFVGPRPEWVELAKTFEKEIPFYTKRYLVKPGIIGWAQINFPPSRSLEQVREKFEYDLYYIKNRSLLLDFEIILKAVKLFFW